MRSTGPPNGAAPSLALLPQTGRTLSTRKRGLHPPRLCPLFSSSPAWSGGSTRPASDIAAKLESDRRRGGTGAVGYECWRSAARWLLD